MLKFAQAVLLTALLTSWASFLIASWVWLSAEPKVTGVICWGAVVIVLMILAAGLIVWAGKVTSASPGGK